MFYNRHKNPEAQFRFRGWSASAPEQKVVFMHKPAPRQGRCSWEHAPIVAPVLPNAPPDRRPHGALLLRIFSGVCVSRAVFPTYTGFAPALLSPVTACLRGGTQAVFLTQSLDSNPF